MSKNNNNPGNSKKMYTSTPLRKKQGIENSRFTDDDDTSESRQNQKYFSVPRESYNSSANRSDNNEFQSLPVDTYNNTMPELLNENELELVIESDTEESDTNYGTPDTSFLKSNQCHPLYFENAHSNQSTAHQSTAHQNNYTEFQDTDYIDIPFNIKDYNKPSTSSATCSDSSSSTSKNKKFLMENSTKYKDLPPYFRGRASQEYDASESDDELDDYPPNLTSNVNKDPHYLSKNDTWNPNYNHAECSKKTARPHISMETYPCSKKPLKTNSRPPPCNVPFIKEDDYQQFLHGCCDSINASEISSYSNEKTIDPIYLKYARKEDLSAKSDSINMLSVVISTVMLLASKSQVPQNYITWTLKYLKCIKNKQGQYPPNIKKIQAMLTNPSGTGTGQGQGQCMDFLARKNTGNHMDSSKKQRPSNQ